jgi:ComF family protein
MAAVSIHAGKCARCEHEHFWNIAGMARIGPYREPLRKLITVLKYAGHERNAEFAARLLAAEMGRVGWGGQIGALVPVPMSRLRRVQRPCDHALLLARALRRRLGVPVVRAVKRLKHTPSQTNQTSRNSRFENVKDCFGIKRRGARHVAGQTVCIVDNLVTSGATVCEVSKVLRRAGAKKIYVAVIARTVLPGDPSAMVFSEEEQQRAEEAEAMIEEVGLFG